MERILWAHFLKMGNTTLVYHCKGTAPIAAGLLNCHSDLGPRDKIRLPYLSFLYVPCILSPNPKYPQSRLTAPHSQWELFTTLPQTIVGTCFLTWCRQWGSRSSAMDRSQPDYISSSKLQLFPHQRGDIPCPNSQFQQLGMGSAWIPIAPPVGG